MSPDEEGIETDLFRYVLQVGHQSKMSPDEEGIETSRWANCSSGVRFKSKMSPDEEGIETWPIEDQTWQLRQNRR